MLNVLLDFDRLEPRPWVRRTLNRSTYGFLHSACFRRREGAARYRSLKETLAPLRPLYEGKKVLDFGASHGTAIFALLELGAGEVIGVEPVAEWVEAGRRYLDKETFGDRASLLHVPDTRSLPFRDSEFEVVLANAVLEHIPRPRKAYLRELWRVLRPGGFLIVNETPNVYLPKDFHTTGLWFVPWLPAKVARRYSILRGRYDARGDWPSSGWRGLGYLELVGGIGGTHRLKPEARRWRHRLLSAVGLPASILDPYPLWILEKLQ